MKSICLRDWEVRAILGGTLTVLWRPIPAKWRPEIDRTYHSESSTKAALVCPLGWPGARLIAKEAWAPADIMYQDYNLDPPGTIAYRADKSAIQYDAKEPKQVPAQDRRSWNWGRITWRSSTQMPIWASRITLVVDDAALRRVQTVTAAEAVASGASDLLLDTNHPLRDLMYRDFGTMGEDGDMYAGATDAFATLWNEIDSNPSWSSNPWAWALTIRRA